MDTISSNNSGSCYGKITDIINGKHFFIKAIPCAIGRTSSRDSISYKERKKMIGKTIQLDMTNYFDTREIIDNDIQSKLILENCKQICPIHFILYYDHKSNEFKIKPIGSCYHNNEPQFREPFIVKSYDNLIINCQLCKSDHVYMIDFPSITKPEIIYQLNPNENMNGIMGDQEGYITNKGKHLPDIALAAKWTNHEKDCLKKYLMTYGYGRWKVIKKNSGGVLNDKSDSEIKIFSNGFIKTIIELLPSEKAELKKYLINLLDEGPNDPYILPKADDWGNVMKQKHPAWGKRLQLLNKVIEIIEKFKQGRKKNKELRKKIDNPLTTNEEKIELSKEISKSHDNWENLLNFIPNNTLYGQKPSIDWSRFHDIDLLRGIYKYGYANYPKFSSDSKLIFKPNENDLTFEPFPQADTITRRLKKLIQLIIKNESNEGFNSLEEQQNYQEPTGFSLIEKEKILDYLLNLGIPLNSEGKNDWGMLRDKLLNANCINDDNKNVSPQKIERLVHILLEISRAVKRKNEYENDDEDLFKEQLDPDGDGFIITNEQSEHLMKRMNILTFMRRYIIPNNYKFFYTGLEILVETTRKGKSMPYKCKENTWKCALHDKTLLTLVEDQGFDVLNKTHEISHHFKQIDFTANEYMERINFICELYGDLYNKDKKKKDCGSNVINQSHHQSITGGGDNKNNNTNNNNEGVSNSNSAIKKKLSKLNIQKDENGNYIYPILINPSLQILNLGIIDPTRQAYHSERNFFPIGYTAIREYQSMLKLGERATYKCEILDGGQKPQYKITPEEEPDNPIIKDSSTGCWMVICNRINELQKNKRPKVTISGTERFGLCDSNVVKLLRTLPNSDQCLNYNKKQLDD